MLALISNKRLHTLCATFGALLLAIWFFYFRQATPSFSPSISWEHGHTGGVIVVHVSRDGQPVTDFPVESESYSGTEGEVRTDISGTAVLDQGESEVVALHLNHQRYHLRPAPGGEIFFLPTISKGLIFRVSL
jgi:hypothetical protein